MHQSVDRFARWSILAAMFAAPTALPCSYVGDPPTHQSKIDNMESIVEAAEIIFLGVIESIDVERYRNTIRIAERLKGVIADEGTTIDYAPPTSCDELIPVKGELLLIYGGFLDDQPYFDYFRLDEIKNAELLYLLRSRRGK